MVRSESFNNPVSKTLTCVPQICMYTVVVELRLCAAEAPVIMHAVSAGG